MAPYFQEFTSPAYKISKTALNMLTVQYAEALRDEGVTFVAVCPGVCLSLLLLPQNIVLIILPQWVNTDMGGKDSADLTLDESIKGFLETANKIDVKDTGKFLTIRVPGWENHETQYDGSVRPW